MAQNSTKKPPTAAYINGYVDNNTQEDEKPWSSENIYYTFNVTDSKKIPCTLKEALASPRALEWKAAMDLEMKSLKKSNIFEAVTTHIGTKVIGSHWVYALKYHTDSTITRYKARLIAQGFTQVPRRDYFETYAPVGRYDSLHLLLHLTAIFSLQIDQMDVETAYLYGDLSEIIHLKLPNSTTVQVKKKFYSLKQSGNFWYAKIRNNLLCKRFYSSSFDSCIFIHATEQFYIFLYVDDLLLFGDPKGPLLWQVREAIATDFVCKFLGIAKYVLGLEIEQTPRGIRLSQRAYTRRILERFGMSECHPVGTPLPPGTYPRRAVDTEPHDQKQYQSIVGSIMYLAIGTRPDLAFTCSILGQYSSRPNQEHHTAAKHALRYIAGSQCSLWYPARATNLVDIYGDASYASDPDNRRSVTGWIFLYGGAGAPIAWSSRLQKVVATSSCEAEYVAAASTICHLKWLQTALESLRITETTFHLHVDNKSAIDLIKNARISDKSKHIDVKHHAVREAYHAGIFELDHVPSVDNLADILTKSLPKPAHINQRAKLVDQT